MPKHQHTPMEIRRYAMLDEAAEAGRFETTEYFVTRTHVIGTAFYVYEAWEIADGRTLEFASSRWEDTPTVGGHWLGRIGSHHGAPYRETEPYQAQYELAYIVIRAAYPEIAALEEETDRVRVSQRMGGIDVSFL